MSSCIEMPISSPQAKCPNFNGKGPKTSSKKFGRLHTDPQFKSELTKFTALPLIVATYEGTMSMLNGNTFTVAITFTGALFLSSAAAYAACTDLTGTYKGREADGGRVAIRLEAGRPTSFSYNGKSFSIRSVSVGKSKSSFKAGKGISVGLTCKSNGQIGYSYRDSSGYSARATLKK